MHIQRSHSLPSKAHWFQPGIQEYLVTPSPQPHHYFTPSSYFPSASPSKKGIIFDKQKLKFSLQSNSTTPAPSYYFKQINTDKQNGHSIQKSSRFSQIKEDKIGVGSYQLGNKTLKENKGFTFGKHSKSNYFTNAQKIYQGIPGPGNYQIGKSKRTHSLTIFKTGKDEKIQRKQNKIKPAGPSTYQISTYKRQPCSVIMKIPLKQRDQQVRQRVNLLRKGKAESIKAGPGKYLKIEQWGKFEGRKKISNGLNFCCRPSPSVYH